MWVRSCRRCILLFGRIVRLLFLGRLHSLTVVAVTGWKSVYVNRGFTKRINGVTKDESDVLLQYLFNVCFCLPLVHFARVLELTNQAGHAKPRRSGAVPME